VADHMSSIGVPSICAIGNPCPFGQQMRNFRTFSACAGHSPRSNSPAKRAGKPREVVAIQTLGASYAPKFKRDMSIAFMRGSTFCTGRGGQAQPSLANQCSWMRVAVVFGTIRTDFGHRPRPSGIPIDRIGISALRHFGKIASAVIRADFFIAARSMACSKPVRAAGALIPRPGPLPTYDLVLEYHANRTMVTSGMIDSSASACFS